MEAMLTTSKDWKADIIDIAVDSVHTFTNLLYDFSNFSDFDIGSFNCACDDSTAICSICVDSSSVIHSNFVASTGSDSFISLPPASNLPLPSTIQPSSLELKPLPEHLGYAYLEDAQKLPFIISSSL